MRMNKTLVIGKRDDVEDDCVCFRHLQDSGIFSHGQRRYVKLGQSGQRALIIDSCHVPAVLKTEETKAVNVYCFDTNSVGSFCGDTRVRPIKMSTICFSK